MVNVADKIEVQTKALSDQVSLLEQLAESGDNKKYLLELEKYNLMLMGSDLSLESQIPSNIKVGDKIIYVPNEIGGYNTLHISIPCKKLKWYDKAFAPAVNKVTKYVNKVNKMLIKHNKKNSEK